MNIEYLIKYLCEYLKSSIYNLSEYLVIIFSVCFCNFFWIFSVIEYLCDGNSNAEYNITIGNEFLKKLLKGAFSKKSPDYDAALTSDGAKILTVTTENKFSEVFFFTSKPAVVYCLEFVRTFKFGKTGFVIRLFIHSSDF